MKGKLFSCLVLMFLSISMMAQKVPVSGTVSDQTGPVIGASVIEKGTTNGTMTDNDGHFTLTVSKGAVIEISSIGYKTQEITVGAQTNFTVTLSEDNEFLDEVVVVGYGSMKKSDLAGASVSMKESDLKGSIISSLDQSLQGRAAGVTAVTTSGAPGSSSSIRVRGQATINANAEPLYVIDGVIVQGGGNTGADFGLGDALGNGKVSTISPLSTINPADIVSMEILKDASATAIYGAQGANGVVLITTKHGKSGEAKFSYDGMVAMSRQAVRLNMMNLREYAQYYNEMIEEGDINETNPYYATPSLLGKGTNWQDEIFRTAWQHQHQLSAQGGSDKVQYYVSGSYMDQQGTIIGSNFNRFSVRTNLDAQLKKWLKLGVNATYAITNDNLKLADSNQGLIYYSLTTIPDIPVYDVNGNYSSTIREGYTSPNPVALAMMDEILLKRKKLSGNIYAELTPIKHITWRTELGFDMGESDANRYKPMIDLGGWVRSQNSISYQKNSNYFWQLKNYLTYANQWGKHSVTAMVGQECWESRWNYLSGSNTDLPSDEVHNVALATGTPSISSGFGSSAMASFFTRETYNYGDRYLGTYTYRYDGSSNFGPKNRWAGFHSVALAWRFSNEKFFEPVKKVIDNGKLRLGWGQTGNSSIGSYAWGAAITRMPSALGMGFRPSNIPNTSIRWESQEQYNVGLDLGFFNGRLNLTVDAYYKRSDDMLMSMQLPSYMGTQGNVSSKLQAPKGNYGSIENKGLEITLDAHPVQLKNFSWDSNFQISFNKNKLLSLSDTENATLVGYGQWGDVVCVSEIGKPLYNFYGYKVEGVYKDLDDIQNSAKPAKYPSDGVFSRGNTVWVGDIKYKDVDENGIIDERDRTDLGSPLPKFTFGWTNTFRYRNLDLSIFLNGSYGNKVMNYNSLTLTHMNSTWTNQLQSVVSKRARLEPIDPTIVYADGSKWFDHIDNVRVKNPGTKIPHTSINDPNDNDRISDRYVEDGSFLRIKNITLGYTFPKALLNKAKIENLRVYVNIQNLYTFTKYTGYDPEVGASTQDSTGLTYGLDNGRYPSPAMYSFGLNITF
ncbi:susC/RagA family TonB-linked outer membrane protein [Bacteroides sp. CAG:545]|nr:susC/RagA family TonB-linked outer membrane protein [Bacteroides sp. CAG:545]